MRFDLRFEVRPATRAAAQRFVDAGAVVRAWQERLGLVPLEGGGWAPLPLDWLAKHGQRVADLLAAREADGRVASHALPALAALCDELEHPPPPGLDRLAPAAGGLRAAARGAAAARISRRRCAPTSSGASTGSPSCAGAGLGGVLADDMGLGKTLQALAVLRPGERDAGGLPDQRAAQLAGRARRASAPA